MNYNQIKAGYKDIDIDEMLRCLYAQCAIENVDTMSESLTKTPLQKELHAMDCPRNNNTYSLHDALPICSFRQILDRDLIGIK